VAELYTAMFGYTQHPETLSPWTPPIYATMAAFTGLMLFRPFRRLLSYALTGVNQLVNGAVLVALLGKSKQEAEEPLTTMPDTSAVGAAPTPPPLPTSSEAASSPPPLPSSSEAAASGGTVSGDPTIPAASGANGSLVPVAAAAGGAGVF